MSALLELEHWHAVDAPFTNPDDWADSLTPGICTACGTDADQGQQHWWHINGNRLCPQRHHRTPRFSPDPD